MSAIMGHIVTLEQVGQVRITFFFEEKNPAFGKKQTTESLKRSRIKHTKKIKKKVIERRRKNACQMSCVTFDYAAACERVRISVFSHKIDFISTFLKI